jgi:CRP-like cAMP-binding protein
MSIEDDIAFLERVPALSLLGRDALRILAIGSESRYVHEGVTLFAEGEDADSAFVVQEGSFELATNGGASEMVGPGALMGELALVAEMKRPTAAIAREPSSVVRITRQLFMKMLESDPAAATRMRDALAARVNAAATEFSRVRSILTGGPVR